jgi:hypothetical protein
VSAIMIIALRACFQQQAFYVTVSFVPKPGIA